jgi:predicted PurR-regulated permease PerM
VRFDLGSEVSRDPWFRALIILATIILGLMLGQMVWGFIAHIGDLLLLFVIAWIISFVLEPTVAGLARFSWVSRTTAVLLTYSALLLALAAVVTVLLPLVAEQSALAAEQLPRLVGHVSGLGSGLSSFLASHEVHIDLRNYSTEILRPVEAALVANGLALATGAASAIAQVLLVVVLSVYFMLDGEHLGNMLIAAVPRHYRDDFIYFSRSLHHSFGGFLRGQIIQALFYGAAMALIMTATGLPFAALSGVIAGLAMFIPFFGPALGMIPPFLAIVTTDLGRLWVLIPCIVLNIIVVNIVAPKVMSQQIGLHPTIVLAAVLIGARLAGPWGAVFGAPIVAVIATMISFYQLTRAERRARVREVTGITGSATETHTQTEVVETVEQAVGPPEVAGTAEQGVGPPEAVEVKR